jgi:hypothetical protein
MIGSWLFLHLEGPDRRMVWGEEGLGNLTGCPADLHPCRRKWPDMVSVSLTLVESATRPKLATPRPTSNYQGILSIREDLGILLIGMHCIPIPGLRTLQRRGR